MVKVTLLTSKVFYIHQLHWFFSWVHYSGRKRVHLRYDATSREAVSYFTIIATVEQITTIIIILDKNEWRYLLDDYRIVVAINFGVGSVLVHLKVVND